jgi:hypothetical protein
MKIIDASGMPYPSCWLHCLTHPYLGNHHIILTTNHQILFIDQVSSKVIAKIENVGYVFAIDLHEEHLLICSNISSQLHLQAINLRNYLLYWATIFSFAMAHIKAAIKIEDHYFMVTEKWLLFVFDLTKKRLTQYNLTPLIKPSMYELLRHGAPTCMAEFQFLSARYLVVSSNLTGSIYLFSLENHLITFLRQITLDTDYASINDIVCTQNMMLLRAASGNIWAAPLEYVLTKNSAIFDYYPDLCYAKNIIPIEDTDWFAFSDFSHSCCSYSHERPGVIIMANFQLRRWGIFSIHGTEYVPHINIRKLPEGTYELNIVIVNDQVTSRKRSKFTDAILKSTATKILTISDPPELRHPKVLVEEDMP